MKGRRVFISLLFVVICSLICLIGCSGSNEQSPYYAHVWTYPANLTDKISPDGVGYFPQVAMDDKGNAIIVWIEPNEGKYQVFKSEYRNGQWTHPSGITDTISISGYDATGSPQVAMDNHGNAIIVWSQSDGTNNQIFKSEYRNGSWTHPAIIADNISPDGQDAFNPKVDMDNNDNAIIAWRQGDGTNNQIFKSEYRNNTWTHPTSLSDNISPNDTFADNPQVAMDNNGNAIIVWNQSDSINNQIFKSEYRNSTWTHPIGLSDNSSPDGQDAQAPQVAMDNNGNAIIVWSQSNGINDQIFKSEYRNSTWTNPASLADNISPDDIAYAPQVAMDNHGNAIIVWNQFDGTYFQVLKSEYRQGAWKHPADSSDNISLDGHTDYYHNLAPQVAMDNNGNAIIVWSQYDGANDQVFKSEYRYGAWTNPADLSDNISPDGFYTHDGQVAMDNNGNAIIVWVQNDQIFKSEYR